MYVKLASKFCKKIQLIGNQGLKKVLSYRQRWVDSSGRQVTFQCMHEIWIDQSGFRRWVKLCCLDINVCEQETHCIGKLFSLEAALNIHKKGLIIPKTISCCKKWKTKLPVSIRWGQSNFKIVSSEGKECLSCHFHKTVCFWQSVACTADAVAISKGCTVHSKCFCSV